MLLDCIKFYFGVHLFRHYCHEHIYWDQASVLVQVGLLDPKNLPVVGDQSANKLLKITKI